MLKQILRRNFSQNMSQTSISKYFIKTPSSQKRKHEEIVEQSESTSSDASSIFEHDNHPEKLVKTLVNEVSSAIGPTWKEALSKEFSKPKFKELTKFLEAERKSYTIYPPEKHVYEWTRHSKISDVKVVILGQDPYHGPNQAHGLAFSVPKGIAIPKSLINIFGELKKDIPDFEKPSHGCLIGWAAQGVLLLNTVLTVRSSSANSHKNKGWELFTDAVIKWISDHLSNVVFLLWGDNAKVKSCLICKDKHLILTAPHPSPLSAYRGFFGCQHFSKANNYLVKNNRKPIHWKYLP